jgi:hypothetical protein
VTPFGRFDKRASEIGGEAVIDRIEYPEGFGLLIAVRGANGFYVGRYGAPGGDVQLAAALLLDPAMCRRDAVELDHLDRACHHHGLALEFDGSFLDVADVVGCPVLRHPVPLDDVSQAAGQAMAYLDRTGWLDGVALRSCPVCKVVRPLADFRADGAHPDLLAVCRRHREAPALPIEELFDER